MLTFNVFKRYKVKVQHPDTKAREGFCVNDAKSRVLMLAHKMFDEADLKPGDEIIFDVRVQVERKENGTY